jgi:Cu/Ag efflux pump CusA
VLTGGSDAIIVRIYGPDLQILRDKQEEVWQALSQIEGIVDLHKELLVEESQVEVRVNLGEAIKYGLKPGDVIRAASTVVNGLEVGDIFWGDKVIDVNIIGKPETRHSMTSLREMPIDTPTGEQVRLGDIASVEVVASPNAINHERASRRIDVGANVRGRDLGSVAREVEQRLQQIDFPQEYHPEMLGEYAERQAAEQRILGLAIVAVLGIFLLLQASFHSWRMAVLAFLALPAALLGGVLATFFVDGVISLGSLVGLLTVLGIAARNGIMLISHYQHLEQEEGEPFGVGLILRGARERLAPILMTAATTGLAVIPLVIAGNIPGHEIEHPMAIVILGGLVTSTLLNLFAVPIFYLHFGKSNRPAGAAQFA